MSKTARDVVGKHCFWWLGVIVTIVHSIGTIAKPFGKIGSTRWADWADLATPFVVILLAAAAMASRAPSRRMWVLFLVGAVVYVEGHGIHLAANSIGNFETSRTQHLWDEVVGHHLWFIGMWLIVAALVSQFAELQVSPLAYLAAVGFALNNFLVAIEGETVLLMTVGSLALIAFGLRRRSGLGWHFIAASFLTLVSIATWRVYWGGFPSFGEVGWT